jgi:ATP-dependent helicase/nuclease subunit B
MKKAHPSVFTITPGSRFLHVLADRILAGFPFLESDKKPALSSWTILLPTRRAVRELSEIFASKVEERAVLLPLIKSIGDVDEDHILSHSDDGDLPPAISHSGQLLTVMCLLEQWAAENPQIMLAQEIRNSAMQTLNLAISLLKLLDQVEIEETNFDKLSEAYDADLSDHRNAILSLINLLKIDLPAKLHSENLMSPVARRSKLIRLEAHRIERGDIRGPLIAAGSTGTIPATRALLKAISLYDEGAVILPGLDQVMDDMAWSAIEPEHPQHSLKILIEELGMIRRDIEVLGPELSARTWLGSELMRPSSTADQWHDILKNQTHKITEALQGVNTIEAFDRHKEARVIALILRETLEHKDRTAALITPDRDLAQRVKAELQRWDIQIDDSAGEPLAKFGLASLSVALIAAIADDVSSISLLSLLSHADCDFGLGREDYLKRFRNLEIAVLRGYGNNLGLEGLKHSFERAAESRRLKQRSHPLIAQMNDQDWSEMYQLVLIITATLKPLTMPVSQSLSTSFDLLSDCLKSLAPAADWSLAPNVKLVEILFDLNSQSHRYPAAPLLFACSILNHMLRSEPLRTGNSSHTRLAIYGVLEARLISTDVTILGGLNEGKWPAQPDPGPWLNRTMRSIFGMQQPERDIGVSAHDFAQSFGSNRIYLTWAKRINGAPQIPSRWILRLQTVLEVAHISVDKFMNTEWAALADAIDQPTEITPTHKPKPTPPIVARPVQFSVSAVENLIRDPYGLYASKVLRLKELSPLAKAVDAPLRGSLFHAAIDNWNREQQLSLAENSLALLIASGEKTFEPFKDDIEVMFFWWPRFLRMAKWLDESEHARRENTLRVLPEITGQTEFEIEGINHILTARADRIDILNNGLARIIDYKSGALPSVKQIQTGMKPQLPLEAALLALAGFQPLNKMTTEELVVLYISGIKDDGKERSVKAEDRTPTELGLAHFTSFKKLLKSYRNQAQAYYPRANMFKEEEASDYDHLSRYAEWMLAGEE